MEKRILELALETLEKQRAVIDAEIADIGARMAGTGGIGTAPVVSTATGRRRTMSAARRKAVSKRMKAYWAARKSRAAKRKAGPKKAAAQKASERMKAYWAQKKAAAAKAQDAKKPKAGSKRTAKPNTQDKEAASSS